jgi:anaerobic magnesium-protoporphyrin IX monomethyl ester cyclase
MILFTHSYFLRFDPKQWATAQPYPPLGTLYAAALMREHGYEVSFFDTMFATSALDIAATIEQQQPDIFVLYDDGFNYLTKMCLTNMREAAFGMIQMAKAKGCTVIVSSSDSTDHYEQYLERGADFVIMGEAEMTLLELVQAIPDGNFDHIPGLAFQSIKTARRTVMKDLDALPFPAWDLLDITPYRNMWLKSSGYFSLNMATTRGCPFKCNWCAKPIYGNRYNSRSPENVVQELQFLKEQFQFDHIWFCDDIFGLKPGWVHAFANLIEQEQLQFKFKIQCRADLLLQENYIKDLARAGCHNIWMGAESGSQKILDAMDKGTTVEQIFQSTRLLKKNGIHPSFFIQFGYPGETKEDIAKTIRMIRELMPYEIGISVSYPLPGTPFYERVKTELTKKSNWTDSDELLLMFHNTYPPEYYKKLHRYVHLVFRKQQAWMAMRKALKNPLTVTYAELRKMAAACWHMPGLIYERMQLNRYVNE